MQACRSTSVALSKGHVDVGTLDVDVTAFVVVVAVEQHPDEEVVDYVP